MRTKQSIRQRLLWIAAVPICLMTVVLVAYFSYVYIMQINNQLRDYGNALARQLAPATEYGVFANNRDLLGRLARSMLQEPNVVSVQIEDAQGSVLYHAASESVDAGVGTHILYFEHLIRSEPLPGIEAGWEGAVDSPGRPQRSEKGWPALTETLGKVTIGVSSRGAYSEQIRFLMGSLVITALTLFGVIYLARRSGARVARSITELTGLVGAIGAGDLGARHSGYDAEVSDLAALGDGINQMAVTLERMTKGLEQRVEEATEDLRKSVVQLAERSDELASARDFAERLNRENRRLIGEMNRLLEEERKDVAREIHDQLNATLVAVKLEGLRIQSLLQGEVGKESIEEIQRRMKAIVEMSGGIYDMARSIVRRLRPEVIDSLGLVGALQDMMNGFDSLQPHCDMAFVTEGEVGDQLDDQIGMAIYRIAQEAMNNVIKHAAATKVRIRLSVVEEGGDNVCIRIEDDGRGFDPRTVQMGVGLLGMRERAYALGGELTLDSEPGRGTVVQVCFPLTIR